MKKSWLVFVFIIAFSLTNMVWAYDCSYTDMQDYSLLTCAMYNPNLAGQVISFYGCYTDLNRCCCDVGCNGVRVGIAQCGPASCTDTAESGNYWVNQGKPCGNILSGCYSKINYYYDSDVDSYGSSTRISSCTQPANYVTNNQDCNDTNSAIKPGATEICDGKDNDCDGLIDEGGVCISCGNGKNETGEQCDDGNIIAGDGCNSTCRIESGWNCVINASGSTVCNLINVPVRNATCSGSIPANATLNDGGLGGNFTQTFIDGVWSPSQKNFSYNPTADECNFKCDNGFSWDILSQSCVIGLAPEVLFCNEILNDTICNADTFKNGEIAKRSLGENSGAYCDQSYKGGDCNFTVKCLCVWDYSKDLCRVAMANYTLKGTCTDQTYKPGSCNIELKSNGDCKTSSEILITRTANWFPSNSEKINCESSTESYLCPSTTKLSFFSDISLVLAILLIILVYFYLTRKFKRKKHK